MRITPINSHQSFQSLYKTDYTPWKENTGSNTRIFWYENQNDVIPMKKQYSFDVFVIVPDKKDAEFEECIKKDHGKYWKSRPLNELLKFDKDLFVHYAYEKAKDNKIDDIEESVKKENGNDWESLYFLMGNLELLDDIFRVNSLKNREEGKPGETWLGYTIPEDEEPF